MKIDYNRRAVETVSCSFCGAQVGSPCIGSLGRPIVGTHTDRRHAATKSKHDPLSGFLFPVDAIAPCGVCDAEEGRPCKSLKNEKLKHGYVHFGRRIRRLLLTAKAPEKREAFEAEVLRMLRESFVRTK